MSIVYHSDCCPVYARQLALLVLEAYRFYNDCKKDGSIPGLLMLDGQEYRIVGGFRAKALPLGRSKLYGFVATRGNCAFVIFRGTKSISEWVSDSRFIQVDFLDGWGRVHKGFKEIYRTCSLELLTLLDQLGPEIDTVYVAGHSLGGALSTLACAEIYERTRFSAIFHYTYASPRVGSMEFSEKYRACITSSFRIMNTEDIVITEPKAAMVGPIYRYAHIGIPFAFSHHGGTVQDNHLLESYLNYL